MALEVPLFSAGLRVTAVEAIYENDAERDHTFEHAEWVDRFTQE